MRRNAKQNGARLLDVQAMFLQAGFLQPTKPVSSGNWHWRYAKSEVLAPETANVTANCPPPAQRR